MYAYIYDARLRAAATYYVGIPSMYAGAGRDRAEAPHPHQEVRLVFVYTERGNAIKYQLPLYVHAARTR